MRKARLAWVIMAWVMLVAGCGSDSEAPKSGGRSAKSQRRKKEDPPKPASPEVAQAVTKTVEAFQRALKEGDVKTLDTVIAGRSEQVKALQAIGSARAAIRELKQACIRRFGEDAWTEVETNVAYFDPYATDEDLAAIIGGLVVKVQGDDKAIAEGSGLPNPLVLKKKDGVWRIQTDSYFKGEMKSKDVKDFAPVLETVVRQIKATVDKPETTLEQAKESIQKIEGKITAEIIKGAGR